MKDTFVLMLSIFVLFPGAGVKAQTCGEVVSIREMADNLYNQQVLLADGQTRVVPTDTGGVLNYLQWKKVNVDEIDGSLNHLCQDEQQEGQASSVFNGAWGGTWHQLARDDHYEFQFNVRGNQMRGAWVTVHRVVPLRGVVNGNTLEGEIIYKSSKPAKFTMHITDGGFIRFHERGLGGTKMDIHRLPRNYAMTPRRGGLNASGRALGVFGAAQAMNSPETAWQAAIARDMGIVDSQDLETIASNNAAIRESRNAQATAKQADDLRVAQEQAEILQMRRQQAESANAAEEARRSEWEAQRNSAQQASSGNHVANRPSQTQQSSTGDSRSQSSGRERSAPIVRFRFSDDISTGGPDGRTSYINVYVTSTSNVPIDCEIWLRGTFWNDRAGPAMGNDQSLSSTKTEKRTVISVRPGERRRAMELTHHVAGSRFDYNGTCRVSSTL